MKLAIVEKTPEAHPWRSLELVGGQLMICTDSGCRLAGAADLEEAVRLLPALLAHQDRAHAAQAWRAALKGSAA